MTHSSSVSSIRRVALLGAGGKMGTRMVNNLRAGPYELRCVEVAPAGVARLQDLGLAVYPSTEAVAEADAVVFAVPDNRIAAISAEIVPKMRSGAIVVCLDPAAPCAGRLERRDDLHYFASHPCHPPLFGHEPDPEVARDYFGGIAAKQDIVCALFGGDESAYGPAEALCIAMYRPVMQSYRVTIEQMAILEPALSETTIATCIVVMKEAIEEAIRRGVPRDAAYAFATGHIKIAAAIVFGAIESPFSDAARKAVERAKPLLFRDDWKRVFDDDNNRACLQLITTPTGGEGA